MTGHRDAREIIEAFQTCEWRSTRFALIDELGQSLSKRAIEFLIGLSAREDDLPIAEAAIAALGRSKNRLASRFLSRAFASCPETLKTPVAAAIGHSGDRAAVPALLEALTRSLETQDERLSRALVLTLGQLKETGVLPVCEAILSDPAASKDLRQAALLSYAKVSRDPLFLDRVEKRFQSDLFEFHLFEQARLQTRFRSAWKVEDYLKKLVESDAYHPDLPLELRSFPAQDVWDGFSLLDEARDLRKLCDALRGVEGDAALGALKRWLAKADAWGEEAWLEILRALSDYDHPDALALLDGARERALASPQGALLEAWLDALVYGPREGSKRLRAWVEEESFPSLDESIQIKVLNAIGDACLIEKSDPAVRGTLPKWIESLVELEWKPSALARLFRLYAQIGNPSSKVNQRAKAALSDPALAPSIWVYAESVPQKPAQGWILERLSDAKARAAERGLLLRAIRSQEAFPEKERAAATEFLRESLSDGAPETQLRALQAVARHPDPKLKPELDRFLKKTAPPELQVAAIVALKAFRDDALADRLGGLLESPVESVRGRALDALIALPGVRAKRIAIDELARSFDAPDVVDKICRQMAPPETGLEYFIETLNELTLRHPDSPQIELLQTLRDRLLHGKAESDALAKLKKKPDIEALDREIAAELTRFESIHEGAKTALRSAEMIVHHPEIFDEYVDKSSAVIAYCKAIDLYLDHTLGRRHLMPRLESSLHEFQTALYSIGLADPDPRLQSVQEQLGLKGKILEQAFPLHKMTLVAQGILSGRILNDPFRVLDGLRAWAVILLIFPRLKRPLLSLKDAKDEQIVGIAKRLMALQEVRNPAAHRQTLLENSMLAQIRKDVFDVLNQLQRMLQ